jgi:hypothetical protein
VSIGLLPGVNGFPSGVDAAGDPNFESGGMPNDFLFGDSITNNAGWFSSPPNPAGLAGDALKVELAQFAFLGVPKQGLSISVAFTITSNVGNFSTGVGPAGRRACPATTASRSRSTTSSPPRRRPSACLRWGWVGHVAAGARGVARECTWSTCPKRTCIESTNSDAEGLALASPCGILCRSSAIQ